MYKVAEEETVMEKAIDRLVAGTPDTMVICCKNAPTLTYHSVKFVPKAAKRPGKLKLNS